MFSKYYNFISSKLDNIGFLSEDTTFVNYLRSVIGGLAILLMVFAIIGVISSIFAIPYLVFSFFILKPFKLGIDKLNVEMEDINAKFNDETKHKLQEEIKKNKKSIYTNKKNLIKERGVKYYCHISTRDSSSKKIQKEELELERKEEELELEEYKIANVKKARCYREYQEVVSSIKLNMIKVAIFIVVYIPVVLPLLLIIYDYFIGVSSALRVWFLPVVILTPLCILIYLCAYRALVLKRKLLSMYDN